VTAAARAAADRYRARVAEMWDAGLLAVLRGDADAAMACQAARAILRRAAAAESGTAREGAR
jgi:hypothetical protein